MLIVWCICCCPDLLASQTDDIEFLSSVSFQKLCSVLNCNAIIGESSNRRLEQAGAKGSISTTNPRSYNMARVKDIELHEVPDELKDIYTKFSSDYGPFANQVKVFAHRPPALKHIMGMLLELADDALLPKRYLEIALVVVSKLNECDYCVTHHAPKLISEGFSSETADRILESDCPGLNQVERLVRDYSIQVTQNANRVTESTHVKLREHFSEAQIVELTLRIALCGFFNRFNDAMGIETEDDAISIMMAVES